MTVDWRTHDFLCAVLLISFGEEAEWLAERAITAMRWNVYWCIEWGSTVAWLLIGDLVILRRVLVEMDDHGVPRFTNDLVLACLCRFFRWTLSPPIPA